MATSVIIAAGPHDAADLLPPEKLPCLHEWAAQAKPVSAACLDVGLSRLPRPKASFALGIDQPLYFSVHSAFATLGPEGMLADASLASAKHAAESIVQDTYNQAEAA